MVAHINKDEADLLKRLGGSGTTNPETGLPEFFSIGDFATIASAGSDIIGTGASIYGALSSANAQEEAAQQRGQFNELALETQERMLDAQLGKRIDAQGNVVQYDEESNTWRVIPSPTTQDIIEAQQAETLTQLTEDAARNRRAAERQEDLSQAAMPELMAQIDEAGDQRATRGRARDMTEAQMSQLQQPDQYTRAGIEGVLTNAATAGIDESFDSAENAAARTLARTGAPSSNTFDEMARERGEALANARSRAAAQALGMAPDLNTQEDANVRSNLSSVGSLAQGNPPVPQGNPTMRVSGSNAAGSLSNALTRRMQGAQGAAGGLSETALTAAGQPGVANTGLNTAGAIAGGGALLQDLSNILSQGQDNGSLIPQNRTRGNTSSGGFGTTGGNFTMTQAPGLRF
jgi:hypothetical protein